MQDAARRDQGRAEKMGWGRWDPVSSSHAYGLFRAGSFRCVVTANELGCKPMQLNTMRCVLFLFSCMHIVTLFVCSLDAIDSRLPHTADNVQWVCLRVNLGKSEICFFAVAIASHVTLIPRSGKRTFDDAQFRAWAEGALRTQGVVSTLADVPFNA